MIRRAFLTLSLIMGLLCASQAQNMMLFSSDSLSNISSPLDIPDLHAWYMADQGIVDSLSGTISNNEGVLYWYDQSGNGRTLTMDQNTRRPVYKTNVLAGYPGVQFDRSNDYLYQSSTGSWTSDDFSIVIVMKFANATQNSIETILSRLEGNNRQINFRGQNTASSYRLEAIAYKDGLTTNLVTYHTSSKHSNYKLHIFTHDGGSTQVWKIDGSSQTVNTVVSGTGDGTIFDVATSRLLVGCVNGFSTPSNYFGGTIVELIIFDDDLSSAEISAIENYLNKKYDLY